MTPAAPGGERGRSGEGKEGFGVAELLRGHHGTKRKPLGIDPGSFIPPEPVVRSVLKKRGLAWSVTSVTMNPRRELVAGSAPPEKRAPGRGEETFRPDPAATTARRRLPDPSQRIEIQRTRANHMAAAMSPDIVEELEGHPDPVLKITTFLWWLWTRAHTVGPEDPNRPQQ